MLGALLPPGVVVAEAFDDPPGVRLYPEEEAVIARAVDKRRREFTTGRHCARRALAGLGVPAEPLLPGERGAPGWPPGVAGSLTHCEGYRAAAVARARDVASLGVDAEPHGPLPEGVLDSVALPAESTALAGLARRRPDVHWDRLLFSAKETVYKTWFPLTGLWLGFEEARIDLVPDPEEARPGPGAEGPAATGTFRARLLRDGRDPEGRDLTVFDGRWRITRGLVLTAAVHPADAR
ncbi:4'-phosphopantetheinyl transferase family protein [Streptomyces sp. JNUCC 64]